MSRCCRCGCDKINFKVFDFANGNLIWEKLINSPIVADNGDVYGVNYGDTFFGYNDSGTLLGTRTLTLPARDAATTFFANYRPYSVDQHAAADGSVSGNSGHYGCVTEIFNALDYKVPHGFCRSGMKASGYITKANGDTIAPASNTARLEIFIPDPTSTKTELTYYLEWIQTKTDATVTLQMDSIGTADTHSDCTFNLSDSTATIESNISTAFGTNITSVTVTGDTLKTSSLKVVIDWADAAHYLKTYKCTSCTKIGTVFVRNLKTGILTSAHDTGGTASQQGHSVWASDGKIFRQGYSGGDRIEKWDTSTDPWTLDWSATPLSGRTPITYGETLDVIEVVAAGGIVGISFPLTGAFSDPLVNRMSVITWNNDGTGREEYHGSGNHQGADLPFGLCIEDGGTDLASLQLSWRDKNVELVHGSSSTELQYRSNIGQGVDRWESGSGWSALDTLCLGDANKRHYAGFDDTASSFCDFVDQALDKEADATCTSGTGTGGDIEIWAGEEDSGIGFPEIKRWRLSYKIFSNLNSLPADDIRWRLVWDDGTTTQQTGWLDFDADLGDLNNELQTTFGDDVNSTQNVEAEDTVASPTTPVPLYKTGITIDCLGAKNVIDQVIMQTPAIFTVAGPSIAAARSQMPTLTVEFEDFEPHQDKTFGAIDWSTGANVWARNFNPSGNPKKVTSCVLHDGQLYVLSVKQCAEGTYYA